MTIPGVYSIYADGSSHSSSGLPGGYGWVIVLDKYPIAAGSGGSVSTTNNIMELRAAIAGIKGLKAMFPDGCPGPVELVSDSKYALGIASGKFNAAKNKEDADELRALAEEVGIFQFRWVRGHDGNKWNERCDRIAKLAKMRHTPVPGAPPIVPGACWIPLLNKGYALVDENRHDSARSHVWHQSPAGFAVSRGTGKLLYLHRMIARPEDEEDVVVHINGDRLDCRLENLEVRPPSPGIPVSKYPGVQWREDAERWRGFIDTPRGREYIGYFEKEVDAATKVKLRMKELA